MTLASRLFAALAVEPPGSRAALQEALAALASALAAGINSEAAAAATVAAAAGGSSGQQAGGVGGLQAAAAAASKSTDPAKLQEIEEMLLTSMSSDQVGRRKYA